MRFVHVWLLLAVACSAPSTESSACHSARDCAPTQTCEAGACVEVASPECKQSSDCVLPPPGKIAEGAECWGGACHYPSEPGANSITLIEQALEAGEIDDETALEYKVFAAFGDSRLPEKYKGDDSHMDDAMVTAEVRHRFDALSVSAQQILAPFLLPPTAPGSWLELGAAAGSAQHLDKAIEWKIVESAAGVRFWYQTRYAGDDAKAQGLAAAADGRILAKLDEAMGTRWLSDAGLPNNGGDGRLDVYLVRGTNVYGLTTPYKDCQKSPVWILVDSKEQLGDDNTPGLVQTLAHEWLHAIQMGLAMKADCRSYFWLCEMTAVWMEDDAYPNAASEQIFARSYLDTTYWSLDGAQSGRWYGEYLYPFYLTRIDGHSPSLVGNIWQNAASKDPLEALDSDGMLQSYWGDFTVANWNRPPSEKYKDTDKLSQGVKPFNPPIVMTPQLRQQLPLQLPHTAAMYYDLKFSDPRVSAVYFYNGQDYNLAEESPALMGDDVVIDGDMLSYEEDRGSSLRALVKVEGKDWEAQDWGSTHRAFCRDVSDQRLEEIVLIAGNSEIKKDAPNWLLKERGLPSTFLTSDIGCWRWTGTLSRTIALEGGSSQLTAQVVWELDDPGGFWEYQKFKLVSGKLTFHHSDTNSESGCTENADASFDLGIGEDDAYLGTNSAVITGGRERAYWGYAKNYHPVYWHGGCPDPEQGWIPWDDTHELGLWWRTRDWLPHQADAGGPLPNFADGKSMSGEFVDGIVTYEWNLTAEKQ